MNGVSLLLLYAVPPTLLCDKGFKNQFTDEIRLHLGHFRMACRVSELSRLTKTPTANPLLVRGSR